VRLKANKASLICRTEPTKLTPLKTFQHRLWSMKSC